MRLSEFIASNKQRILQAWEDFARSLPPGRGMDTNALRDDVEQLLLFIAEDMETSQTAQQQFDKSIGRGPLDAGETAAQKHGLARLADKFSLAELVSEYRALRASVTTLWLDEAPKTYETVLQLVRFNEAIDQVLAESVVRYADRADKDSDLFTATISHDLRTPLSAIAMCANVLDLSSALSEPDRKAAHQIQLSVNRIQNMLGELADFTRLRLGGLIAYDKRTYDVASLCREVVTELRAAHGRQIEFAEIETAAAVVDRGRFLQMLSNLVGNAIKHGAADSVVNVSVSVCDDDVRIAVSNIGPSISQEHIHHIFDPLYRATRESSIDPGSLGLGLYIARTIARAHGGDIEVRSNQREGTTFTVRLPKAGAPPAYTTS